MTDDQPKEIDTLMQILSLSGDELANLPKQDLDKIIAYQRKLRVQREGGGKTKKESGAPAVDIRALMNKVQPAPATSVELVKDKPGDGRFIRRF